MRLSESKEFRNQEKFFRVKETIEHPATPLVLTILSITTMLGSLSIGSEKGLIGSGALMGFALFSHLSQDARRR